MSSHPLQNSLRRGHFGAFGQFGSVNHYDRKAQRTRSFDFGGRTGAAGVFADNNVNAMFLKQRRVARNVKGSARNNNRVAGQGWWHIGCIDQPQNVVMLRLGGKGVHMQPSKRQHHALRRTVQGSDGTIHIGHNLPVIARNRFPSGSRQRQQMRAGIAASLKGIPAHLRGKRVCGVDDMRDLLVAYVSRQTIWTSKTSLTGRNGLCFRGGNTARVAERGLQTCGRHQSRQGAGFGCAAQNQEVLRHVC